MKFRGVSDNTVMVVLALTLFGVFALVALASFDRRVTVNQPFSVFDEDEQRHYTCLILDSESGLELECLGVNSE